MEFVTALLIQISWTNHLAIMSKAKTVEERHFYITLCVKESYSSREVERQIDSGYYERFYLEALDRQKKKENENPSVGMILCASKNNKGEKELKGTVII